MTIPPELPAEVEAKMREVVAHHDAEGVRRVLVEALVVEHEALARPFAGRARLPRLLQRVGRRHAKPSLSTAAR